MRQDRAPKKKTSMTLTEDGKQLLADLAEKLGLSQAGVVELAIRRLASAEGVEPSRKQELP